MQFWLIVSCIGTSTVDPLAKTEEAQFGRQQEVFLASKALSNVRSSQPQLTKLERLATLLNLTAKE